MNYARIVIPFLCLILLSSRVEGEDLALARDHNRKGTRAYDLGHYLEAAKEYEAAYEIVDDPALLYNIAQAFRLGGDSASALRSYRSFLRRMPDAANRPEVELKITELQKVIQQQTKAKEAAALLAASPAPQGVAVPSVASTERDSFRRNTPVYKRWWLWTAVAAVAVVGVGVGLGIALAPAPSAPNATTNGGTFHPFGQ